MGGRQLVVDVEGILQSSPCLCGLLAIPIPPLLARTCARFLSILPLLKRRILNGLDDPHGQRHCLRAPRLRCFTRHQYILTKGAGGESFPGYMCISGSRRPFFDSDVSRFARSLGTGGYSQVMRPCEGGCFGCGILGWLASTSKSEHVLSPAEIK